MENSSVNKAHYQHRRAETHLRYRRFSEAILCHQTAADLLGEALSSTQTPRAIESLTLQRDYHLKQQDIIRIKREQFSNYRTAVENQRKRMARAFSHSELEDKEQHQSTTLQVAIYKTMEEADSLLEMLFRRGSDSDSLRSDTSEDVVDVGSGGSQHWWVEREQFSNYRTAVENQRKRMARAFSHSELEDKEQHQSTTLQVAIYKTMEEADSLLEMLFRRGSDSDSLRSDTSEDVVDVGSGGSQHCLTNNNTPVGTKRPKDDHVVIEELRTLNQQLHTLVYQLVTQLDASARESDALRMRVKYLEAERLKAADVTSQPPVPRHHNLQVATDSSGATSPYVISPCSELSPEGLLPLEMPVFDYTGFTKK